MVLRLALSIFYMMSIALLVTASALPVQHVKRDGSCPSVLVCCQTVTDPADPSAAALLKSIDVTDSTGLVGLSCESMGDPQDSCSSQQLCCSSLTGGQTAQGCLMEAAPSF